MYKRQVCVCVCVCVCQAHTYGGGARVPPTQIALPDSVVPYAQRLWRTLTVACSRSPPACACSLSASRLRRHPLTHAPRPWHCALRDLRTRPRSKTRRPDSCRRLYRHQLNLPRRREEEERPGRGKSWLRMRFITTAIGRISPSLRLTVRLCRRV